MNDLARSDSYYKKQCLKEFGFIPPQSEIKKRLGPELSRAFFQSCLPALKPYLGLCPTLDGPGDDLWISPSDLLIGKVRLKPPLTSKHVAALTHQGILNIGHEVEKKFNKEHELDKQRTMRESEEMWSYIAEKEKKEAIEAARKEENEKHEEIVAKLRASFQEDLNKELEKLENKLQEEKVTAVKAGRQEAMQIMQEKLEIAILETVFRLTDQFAFTLLEQSKCLHKHFWYHLRLEKQKHKESIQQEKVECKEMLENLRVELQCENIANIMYVLAKERRKCSCEKQIMEQNFMTRLEELEKELEDKNEQLKKATSQLKRIGEDVQARNLALYEIIKQFQKFIYFVLRAVPTQAEYLLNVEKLMIFELTQSVMTSKPDYFATGTCQCQELTTESDSESLEKSIIYSEAPGEKSNDLLVNDYHNCGNRFKYIPSAETLRESEDLPAFTYNENLYVREDFRNMISQGLEISESNEFWNFATNDVIELIKPRKSSDILAATGTLDTNLSEKDQKLPINVRFSKKKINEVYIEEQVIQSHSYTSNTSNTDVDREKSESRPRISKLSLARDSILVIKLQKERLSGNLAPMHAKRDSIILNARKSAESKISGTKDIINRRKDSKIELAVDSLTLLRSGEKLRSKSSISRNEQFTKKCHYVSVGVQADLLRKNVRISHIEIIPSEHKKNGTPVMFSERDKVIPDTEDNIKPSTKQLPLKWRSPEEIYGRSNEVEIVGDRDLSVHLENQDEFTAKRVTSFIRIFREHPSLRDLFTSTK